MKKVLVLRLMLACGLSAGAADYTCSKCQRDVKKGDRFCMQCGSRLVFRDEGSERMQGPTQGRPQPQGDSQDHTRYQTPKNARYQMSFPSGAGRGLVEVVCSPVEFFRAGSAVVTGAASWGNPVGSTIGGTISGAFVIMSAFSVLGDVSVGTLDVLTLGAFGNYFWSMKDHETGSPYVIERDWVYGRDSKNCVKGTGI